MAELERSASFEADEQNGLLDDHPHQETQDVRSFRDASKFYLGKYVPTGKRPRLTIGVITFWTACSMLLAFVYLTSRDISNQDSSSISNLQYSARLRDEKDYILDPSWRFDDEPQTREYYWNIEEAILNPDGVFRPMLLINQTFPGPLIECNEGDEIVIHLDNRASNATSIHWHGIYQNGTNWMDGTVGVTQCPIAPGHSFTYRFNVSGQAGSYFYHSHMSMQASDGLTGPLIIHPRGPRGDEFQLVEYVQDRVVLLSDHYYDPSYDLLMQYLAPDRENEEPVPPSALINGRNLRDCSSLPERNCSADGMRQALFDLAAHGNTRLRIINVGAFAEFSVQIDEHDFDITEVDGVDVVPHSIHRLNINPAQRYSIVLSPKKGMRPGAYWMRARMITHCFAYEEPELQEEVRAIVRFGMEDSFPDDESRETPIPLPKSKDWTEIIDVECRDLNTSMLEPVVAVPPPTIVNHALYLRSSFQIRDWALSRGYLNESSFRVDVSSPVLNRAVRDAAIRRPDHRSLDGGTENELLKPYSQLIYRTSGISTVDVLIQNFDDGNHPFHLHGYKFWILDHGHGYPPSSEELYTSLNLKNPLRRDVVSVEAYGWTLLRFVADNPGAWAFHCHLGWHTEAGLMMVFLNRIEEMENIEMPVEVNELCSMPGIERGMAPSDDIWIGKPS